MLTLDTILRDTMWVGKFYDGGRLLDVYFDKAVEILKNEVGPIEIYPGPSCFRFIGDITMVY